MNIIQEIENARQRVLYFGRAYWQAMVDHVNADDLRSEYVRAQKDWARLSEQFRACRG